MICTGSFYLTFLLFVILQKVMLFLAMRYGAVSVVRILVVDFLFTIILLFDLPWLFYITAGVCK